MTETTTNPPAEAELETLVAELVSDLRKIRERIPDFTLQHASLPRLSGIPGVVPQPALEACFDACKAEEALAKSIDVAAMQYDTRYVSVFPELRNELQLTYRGLDYTIRAKRYGLGKATLRVLNISRRLATSSDKAYLAPYIEQMSKAARRRRNGKKAEPAPIA